MPPVKVGWVEWHIRERLGVDPVYVCTQIYDMSINYIIDPNWIYISWFSRSSDTIKWGSRLAFFDERKLDAAVVVLERAARPGLPCPEAEVAQDSLGRPHSW